ncbi:MAG: PH domain-containing protein [Thermoplasmata archaeon]
MILLLYFVVLKSPIASDPIAVYFLIAVTLFLLVRYFSTGYSLDDEYLYARRLIGGRRIPLRDVRKIEYLQMRDLSATGFFGSWGYRGRMWSPYIGNFDAIYTDPVGLLVSASGVPLFVSPKRPLDFARELSRRVRSYTGPLPVDVGHP